MGGASSVDLISGFCEFEQYPSPPAGRRHITWSERAPVEATGLGAWFARAAADEAGSVGSFRALRRELRRFDFADELLRRLNQAAREEIAHARLMESRAHRAGARRPAQRFQPLAQRSLFEIALENAREGCVAETFAALEMAHQAQHAADSELRADFERIAREEANHAQLAWELHALYLERLSPGEQEQVTAELSRALASLEMIESSAELSSFERRTLGLPSAAEASALRQQLAGELREAARALLVA
ncbi:MAG TPA: ferritin-like domain-containing protein [Polyangiaceae bacterium]|nr:ferritin-like domain-containing protein [Polyangiaceae bacterium]